MAPIKQSILILLAAYHSITYAFQSTPVLGYNSYNQVSCSPSESQMTSAINAMANRGFLAAGYKYIQVDCGWAARDNSRNASTGAINVNTGAFPSGLQSLSQFARSKGFIWSMYSDAGVRMCDAVSPSPVAGSLGHEAADAAFFASLNTQYVKYDNCYADGPAASQNAPKNARTDFPTRYGAMWNALQKVGISGMLICQWGTPYSSPTGLEGPNDWTRGISTSFRLSDDIVTGFSNVYRIYNEAIHIAKSGLIGPGHFADADLLEVGNPGMTFDEQSTHFAFWAMIESALMISTDVNALSAQTVALLQNTDLIAINQDSAGKPITLVQRFTNDYDVWVGDLSNGDKAVLVVDLSNKARTLTINFSLLGIASANVKNLFDKSTATGVSSYSKSVNAHGSLALRLSSTKSATATAPKINWAEAEAGTASRGAAKASCSGCSGGNKVGNLGGSGNGTLTLSNIFTSQASQSVRFDYINGEVGFSFGTAENERLASVSVNGRAPVTVSFPLSGYNWDKDVYLSYLVQLSGFSTTGANTITISGSGSGFAPDVDRVGVLA
ncbi:MAG: hypothetical protein M1820_000087 [Bogoriella megaspora]|nr:MAG: hypothetical protein M1820_000087 [Bogoriella megaspora]